jgi:adenylosuccinate synthase
MHHAHVVIGANYGDEGKGLMTDYLVKKHNAEVVVRFNGGAQAGHTVVTPDGQRHVFSHFGSGTLAGARTFLSKHFVANPILFLKEKKVLEELSPTKKLHNRFMWVDPSVMITTPYDMLINQYAENSRDDRHGSCGVGFGETIERCECMVGFAGTYTTLMALYARELGNMEALHSKLQIIRHEWVPARLKQLGIAYTDKMRELVMSDKLMWRFMEDAKAFNDNICLFSAKNICANERKVVFEGAQGLALDQVQGDFPHVTRSFTGIINVLEICKEANISSIDVHYMTRAYMTRHGNGPLKGELKAKPYKGIKERTNVTNEYQGSFRYANLDADSLRERIRVDLRHTDEDIRVYPKLGVTCIDQIDDVGRYITNGKLKRVNRDNFGVELARSVGIPHVSIVSGPTRNDVKEVIAI